MPIASLKPFIPAGADFETSKKFFTDLGFSVNWEIEGLAELTLGNAVFLLQDFENAEMQANLMMYATVDDLDQWWELLNKSGVLERYDVRAKEPTDYPWGVREIHMTDPAGVCWHFAQK